MPLRSLKRSSDCGALTLGACAEFTDAIGLAVATEVNDEEFPHNS